MAWPRWMANIKIESFILTHERWQDFVFSMWSPDPLVYAIWSTVCAVYTVIMTFVTGWTSNYGIKILIWLTYWSFYALTLRFIFTACNCWLYVWTTSSGRSKRRHSSQRRQPTTTLDTVETGTVQPKSDIEVAQNGRSSSLTSPSESLEVSSTRRIIRITRRKKCRVKGKLPVNVACQWLLQNISNAVSVLITILFWALVYTGDPQSHNSINSHVINSLLVIADVMFNRAPIRMQHTHMPLTFLCIYIGFTLIYWGAGGTNEKGQMFIYSVLDYSNRPTTASIAITIVALFGVPLTQLLFYGLYHGRLALHRLLQNHSCTSQKGVYFVDAKESTRRPDILTDDNDNSSSGDTDNNDPIPSTNAECAEIQIG